MHEGNPDQRHQVVGALEAAIQKVWNHELVNSIASGPEHRYTIVSGSRSIYVEPLTDETDTPCVATRIWDREREEITELLTYPGNVAEPTNDIEVLVNAPRQSYSNYTRLPQEDTPAPNTKRFLSSRDVVVVTRTVPDAQFGEILASDLLTIITNPTAVRDLAPDRVDFFDSELEAEEHAPVVEVLGNPVTPLSPMARIRLALVDLIRKFPED